MKNRPLSLSFLAAALFLMDACSQGPLQTSVPKGELPADPREGRTLFNRNGCFQCHGPEGRGDGMMAPSLKVRPRDFKNTAQYHGGRTPRDIAFTVKYASQWSRVSNGELKGMPDYSHLEDSELLALGTWVYYLQTNR